MMLGRHSNHLRTITPKYTKENINKEQLMTSDEVNTRLDQPTEHDIHRGIRSEYHVPWVDQSLYSLKWKVINCFII